tara:strand:+ start:10033 stop:10278 length:246 start_codon:yes stop_codon:yes gene_type:complete
MSRNPYELRYEIYQQAESRLVDKYHQDHDVWQDFQCWKREQETEGVTVNSTCEIEVRPEFPTHEQILNEAEKIYDFVQRCN